MEDRAGKKLDVNPDGSCTFLNGTRCSLYSIRPVICRLWGVVESMPCPHGCKPERVLTDEEGFGLVAATMELDGDIQGADELRHGLMVMDAEVRTAFRKYVASTNDLGGPLLNPEYVAKAREEFVEVVQRKGPVYPRDR